LRRSTEARAERATAARASPFGRARAPTHADQVLGAGEHEHGDLLEEAGQEADRGAAAGRVELSADLAVALEPGPALARRVEGRLDVLAL